MLQAGRGRLSVSSMKSLKSFSSNGHFCFCPSTAQSSPPPRELTPQQNTKAKTHRHNFIAIPPFENTAFDADVFRPVLVRTISLRCTPTAGSNHASWRLTIVPVATRLRRQLPRRPTWINMECPLGRQISGLSGHATRGSRRPALQTTHLHDIDETKKAAASRQRRVGPAKHVMG